VRAAGADGEALGADLATLAGIESLLAQLPEIDILINNAGSLVRRARLLEFTPQLYDEVMTLNVRSAWAITQAVAPAMIRKGGGIVVNLSSIAARNGGGPGATVYAAAKAAVVAITKGLPRNWRRKGFESTRSAPAPWTTISTASSPLARPWTSSSPPPRRPSGNQRRYRRRHRLPLLRRRPLPPRPNHRGQRRRPGAVKRPGLLAEKAQWR